MVDWKRYPFEVSSIAISCAGPDVHAPLLPSQEEEQGRLLMGHVCCTIASCVGAVALPRSAHSRLLPKSGHLAAYLKGAASDRERESDSAFQSQQDFYDDNL